MLRLCIVEQSPEPSTSHTWSFFRSDVGGVVWSWLAPLAVHRWPGYEVRFPAHARRLSTEYAAITSAGLRQAVASALGSDLRCGVGVTAVSPTQVELADGQVLSAPLVIDGRGFRPSAHLDLAWQKFVGLELRLAAPHGLQRPVLMDADLPQLDGFRFLYLLPFASDVLLAEDTRYSDESGLDADALEAAILAYAEAQGWMVVEVIRRERGVLPVALGGDIAAYWREAPPGVAQSGLRAALFHPTTGYSLPEAARLADQLADRLAGTGELTSAAIAPIIQAHSIRLWRRRRFYRLLNRLMFLAAEPKLRYRVLQRFYRLAPGLIERFYAGRLTGLDRLRLLAGKPPVPLLRAVAVLLRRAEPSRSLHD